MESRFVLRFDADDRRYVYSVGRRMLRDANAAEDVAQEALMLAFQYRHTFRGDSHPRTWLYRITTTTALGYLRRQARRLARFSCESNQVQVASDVLSPHDALVAASLAARALAQLEILDEKYAGVIRLRMDDRPDAEIASMLGMTKTAVKVRVHRARALLRAALEPLAACPVRASAAS